MRTTTGVLLWMTFILFCLYSNRCPVSKPPTDKSFQRRKTYGQLPKNPMVDHLAEFLKKRSKSMTHLDHPKSITDVRSFDAPYENGNTCNGNTSCTSPTLKEVEEIPRSVTKRRCDSGQSMGGESRRSVDSSHRYSETSTYSGDSDSLRRRYLGWNRRFSNYSVATSVQTSLSSFIEPDSALDLAENLMIELFDTDDIDGIIPARFLQSNEEAIVDNIREEELYSPSYSPTASCGHSSFEEDNSLTYNHTGEFGSELRFSTVSSPLNTGSPRSSRHSKSSSPERTDREPISTYPNEGGGLPRHSIYSLTHLDTVEEETASQISPSPRVMSPRISIDNGDSFDALVEQHHAKPTQQTNHRLSVPYMRKVSLQKDHPREHHRYSVDSIPVSENSFYFSITSFDDEFAGKMETIDDLAINPKHRYRKMATVSTPNTAVLQWLAKIPKDASLDPDEPWPFNEGVTPSTPAPGVAMETLAVPERKMSLSEASDLDSFHSCRDGYACSNISGQDSVDYPQLDNTLNEQIFEQCSDQDKDTLKRGVTLEQRISQFQRSKQAAIDFEDEL